MISDRGIALDFIAFILYSDTIIVITREKGACNNRGNNYFIHFIFNSSAIIISK